MANNLGTTSSITLSNANNFDGSICVDATNISSNTYTYTGSNLGITTTTPYSYNYGTVTYSPSYTSQYISDSLVVQLLTEEEIQSILDRAKGSLEKNEIATLCKSFLYARHLSEDLLLQMAPYVDKADVMALHKADIVSGKYAAVALLYKMQ